MRVSILKILSKQVRANILAQKSTHWLMGIFGALLIFSLISGYLNMDLHQHLAKENSYEVRKKWENSPDKHPHRMAHYGYVVFRQKYPLSFFDFGMDSYLGNTIFLEAHRQNTANFSEASLSGGLLRFGEISASMILTLLLPLLIFFWGFGLIAMERENGTLKILLTQGVSWQELIYGKTFGLFSIGAFLLIPTFILTLILLLLNDLSYENPVVFFRILFIILFYFVYLFILCLIAVLVSAKSSTGRSSLIKLIGCWLVFTLVLPRLSQVVGQSVYPSPSKVEFDVAVEAELVKQGDSHNPDDPFYKSMKDSLLKAYNVDSTHKLPFNYAGYRMREGERLSAETFNLHQAKLSEIYRNQNKIPRLSALFNPFMAIKMLSMGLSGTDFETFNDFQIQSERFRYNLAQTMNELQMKYISNKVKNSSDPNAILKQKYWKEFPDFNYQFLDFQTMLKHEWLGVLSILIWFFGLIFWVKISIKKLEVI